MKESETLPAQNHQSFEDFYGLLEQYKNVCCFPHDPMILETWLFFLFNDNPINQKCNDFPFLAMKSKSRVQVNLKCFNSNVYFLMHILALDLRKSTTVFSVCKDNQKQ